MLYTFVRRLQGLPTGHQLALDGEDCGYVSRGIYGDGSYYGNGTGGGFKVNPDGAMAFSMIYGDGDDYGNGVGNGRGSDY